jgi:hypothetical protein
MSPPGPKLNRISFYHALPQPVSSQTESLGAWSGFVLTLARVGQLLCSEPSTTIRPNVSKRIEADVDSSLTERE